MQFVHPRAGFVVLEIAGGDRIKPVAPGPLHDFVGEGQMFADELAFDQNLRAPYHGSRATLAHATILHHAIMLAALRLEGLGVRAIYLFAKFSIARSAS